MGEPEVVQPQLAAVQRSSSKFRTRAPLARRLAPNARRTGPRCDSTGPQPSGSWKRASSLSIMDWARDRTRELYVPLDRRESRAFCWATAAASISS